PAELRRQDLPAHHLLEVPLREGPGGHEQAHGRPVAAVQLAEAGGELAVERLELLALAPDLDVAELVVLAGLGLWGLWGLVHGAHSTGEGIRKRRAA